MDSALRARLAGMPQTPDEMLSAVSESLAARTGRSLEEWLALVRSSGVDPLDQAAVRAWLRREHGVPQNSQWAIADAAAREAGWVRPTVSEYIDGQYAGAKAALRPIYDALATAISELGLRFTDPPDAARLQPGGGPGQATHKVSLRDVGEVDAEVVHLLRVAYEQNPTANQRLAKQLLMRRKSIAQCLPDSRVAEVGAPSDAIHTDFAALVLAEWGRASGGGVTGHRRD